MSKIGDWVVATHTTSDIYIGKIVGFETTEEKLYYRVILKYQLRGTSLLTIGDKYSFNESEIKPLTPAEEMEYL